MYSKQIDSAIDKGCQFINENPGIIIGMRRINLYNDEPKLYSYGVYFKDKYHTINDDAVASGVSFNKKRALLKVLGETIERYSLGVNNNKKFIYDSFNNLVNSNKSALDLEDLIMFSSKQRYLRGLKTKKLHWVMGKSLVSNTELLVPAQLVYVPYIYQDSESLLRFPISTGAAAGENLLDSTFRGICEVVERDSFMISYLNKLNSPKIDLEKIKDSDIKNVLLALKRYKLDLAVIDITTDLGIPAFAAITLDRTGLGPAVSVGLKAGFDIKEDLIGAIEESLMVRSWVRDKFIYSNPNYKRKKEIYSFEDRAHFWLNVSSIKNLDFWLKDKSLKVVDIENPKNLKTNLERAIILLRQKNMEVIRVDITDKNISRYGFKVVKVIIPKLQPLYLDEGNPYFGGDRLYSAPVTMGFSKKPKTENQLNKIPHPFL